MQSAEIDYQVFKRKICSKTGLDLSSYKQAQMERRLRTLMERSGARCFVDYYQMLERDERLLEEFMNRVTINVTEFFRNPDHYAVLEKKVIPELLRRSSQLRTWSSACSYGHEPHSMAICLQEALLKTGHTILATDIDDKSIANARKGQFPIADAKNMPAERISRWFKQEGDFVVAHQKLRDMMEFRKLDLLKDRFPVDMDLILCRNVVIYFTEEAKDDLYAKFYRALKPGGYLFVGGTERINNYAEIGYLTPYPFFYQRPPK